MPVKTLQPRRLLALRLQHGFSQEDLAHQLRNRGQRATAKQVSRWERGSHAPRAAVIPVIADALGVTIDELYSDGDTDDEEADPVADLVSAIRRVVREEVRGL